jgi:hexosaminidase
VPFAIIKDEPLVGYRGIMIDSSRHFLSLAAIKRLIESMPLSKLNILHWHLTDDEAFTIVLKSHPELAETGGYSPK